MSELKAEIMIITPQDAQRILGTNRDNRDVDERKVETMARDLREGRWDLNGETVILDENLDLVDGQHRLLAIVKSGIPMRTFVAMGVDRKSRMTIDTGAARRVGTMLQMGGMSNASRLVSIVLATYQIAKQDFRARLTNQEISLFVARHEAGLRAYANQKLPPNIGDGLVRATCFVGLEYLHDRETADTFMDVMHTGRPSYDDDPAHAAREYLVRAASGSRKLTAVAKAGIITNAFNNLRQGRRIKNARPGSGFAIQGFTADLMEREHVG